MTCLYLVNLASDFPRHSFPTLDAQAWENAMSFAKGNYLLAVNAARQMQENPPPTYGHPRRHIGITYPT